MREQVCRWASVSDLRPVTEHERGERERETHLADALEDA